MSGVHEDGGGLVEGKPAGVPDQKEPQAVFMTKADAAREVRVIEGFDVVVVQGGIPRWLRRQMRMLARRGTPVRVVKI